jgi:hypothetical protein
LVLFPVLVSCRNKNLATLEATKKVFENGPKVRKEERNAEKKWKTSEPIEILTDASEARGPFLTSPLGESFDPQG